MADAPTHAFKALTMHDLDSITAFAQARDLCRLTPAQLARWAEIAARMPDTLAIRQAVTRKTDAPAWGPIFFAERSQP